MASITSCSLRQNATIQFVSASEHLFPPQSHTPNLERRQPKWEPSHHRFPKGQVTWALLGTPPRFPYETSWQFTDWWWQFFTAPSHDKNWHSQCDTFLLLWMDLAYCFGTFLYFCGLRVGCEEGVLFPPVKDIDWIIVCSSNVLMYVMLILTNRWESGKEQSLRISWKIRILVSKALCQIILQWYSVSK